MESIRRYLPATDASWLNKAVWLLASLALAVGVGVRFPAHEYVTYLAILVVVSAGVITVLVIHRVSILPLSFLIVTAVLLPFTLGTRISSAIGTLAVLLGVFAVETLSNQRSLIPVPKRVAIPLFMFLAAATLSLVVGQFPWFFVQGAPLSAQLAGLAIFLLSGGAFLLFATRLNTRQQIERITWVFLGAGALTIVLQLLPTIDQALAWRSTSTGLTDPARIGSMFWTWLVAIAAGQAFLNDRLRFEVRAGLVLVIALVLYHALILNTGWTSGWLPALISLGVVLLAKFPRLTVSLGLLALPFVLLSTGIFDSFWNNEGYSFSTRVAAWHVLIDVLGRSPLIGLGPANYYYYTSLFPILGWYVNFSSHNNYIDIIGQTGLVGFALFWWFIAEMGFLIAGTWRRASIGFDIGLFSGVFAGLLGSLAACMLGDWLIPFVYNVGLPGFRSSVIFWIFLGTTVALRRIVRGSASVPQGQA